MIMLKLYGSISRFSLALAALILTCAVLPGQTIIRSFPGVSLTK